MYLVQIPAHIPITSTTIWIGEYAPRHLHQGLDLTLDSVYRPKLGELELKLGFGYGKEHVEACLALDKLDEVALE